MRSSGSPRCSITRRRRRTSCVSSCIAKLLGSDVQSFVTGIDNPGARCVGVRLWEPSLNEWLQKRAVRNVASGASRTYVVCVDTTMVGYYTLAAGAVARGQAPAPARRNMPDPIPVVVLGRLAVDQRHQSQGLGQALLRDAILRALQAADGIGVKAILVHAILDEARRFYLSRGFLESLVEPMTLCLVLETARQALR